MNTNNAGGGEILQYWGQSGSGRNNGLQYMDESVMRQFMLLPYVKIIIFALLLCLLTAFLLRLFHMKSIRRGKAINNELDSLAKVRKRDAQIIKANEFLKNITSLIEHSPLSVSKTSKDYMNYNLERANIRTPGGQRILRAEEFNAIVKTIQVICCAVSLLVGILVNMMLGIMFIIGIVVLGSAIPMAMIRGTVKAKDNEILENFSEFYLMLHYVLIARSNTSLSSIMRSYDKTTSSDEMHRFIDVCVINLETYGEYEGPTKIMAKYKEIAPVGKLMRLIRQANEGGDIVSELQGFRRELLNEKEYTMTKRNEKTIAKAKASFNILMPILFQAILSAMAIYISDMSLMGSFM